MACTPAPACKAALAEATRIAPNRNRASDGICASPKHTQQNPTSDHEKGEAFDLTHDPANGCNVDLFFDWIVRRRDPRVKYLIRNGRILRSYDKPGVPAWTWDTYTGPNPHTKHGHCSIVPAARNDTRPWFTAAPTQEADLTNEEHTMLAQIHAVIAKGYIEQILQKVQSHVDDPDTGGGAGSVDIDRLRDELAQELAERLAS